MAFYGSSTPFICTRCLRRASTARSRFSTTISPRARHNATFSATSYRYNAFKPTLKYCRPSSNATMSSRRAYFNQPGPPKSLPPAGIAELFHRRLIYLSGPDAPKFLQGLTTNNVNPKAITPWYSAFLDARGRMMWDSFIYPDPSQGSSEWACFIEVDGTEAENLFKHLKRHKLRSKIEIRLVEEAEASVWASWRDNGATESEARASEPPWSSLDDSASDPSSYTVAVCDPRAPGFGWRIVLPKSESSNLISSGEMNEFPIVDATSYHIRRYLYGIPEGPKEMPPASALPMESNIDLMHGIDFRKGCYVGQELTIRTKHTGVVRKRILPVQLYHKTDPNWSLQKTGEAIHNEHIPAGIDIKQLEEDGTVKKGRATGKFLAGISNVGLALCRLEMMTDMKVSAEGGSWRPGMEFGMQWGEQDAEGRHKSVRIKPIVPQWLRDRE